MVAGNDDESMGIRQHVSHHRCHQGPRSSLLHSGGTKPQACTAKQKWPNCRERHGDQHGQDCQAPPWLFKRSKYMNIYGILRESNLSFHPNRKTKAAEPLSKKGEPVEGIQGLSIPNCHGRHAEDIEDHHGVRFLAPAGPVFGQPAVLTNFASWFFYLPTIQRTSLELFFETNGRNNME